jgi:hypothetical protein
MGEHDKRHRLCGACPLRQVQTRRNGPAPVSVEQPGPEVVEPKVEERWAELSDYSLPIESAIDILRATHFKLGHLLKGLKDEDFRRTYVHPQYQYQRDISYLTALYAWHGSHHVGHLKLLKNS